MSKAVKTDREFDIERYAALLEKAKGTRTQAEFARDCGLSTAYICKHLNKRLSAAPIPSTLRKIAFTAANGVSYADLLDAAGYDASKYSYKDPKSDIGEKLGVNISDYLKYFTKKCTCKLKMKECKDILDEYGLPEDKQRKILNIIEETYERLDEVCSHNKALEAYIIDEFGEGTLLDFFEKYLTHNNSPGKYLKTFMEEKALKEMEEVQNKKVMEMLRNKQ